MERSLRATGCDLPILVIPYNENKFELPAGSEWWEISNFLDWIDVNGRCAVMRKYQALLACNYQFVDTDVVFVRNPSDVLEAVSGFVTSCGHWRNPAHTLTKQSERILKERSTMWQSRVFNTGQFASERRIVEFETLKELSEDVRYRQTILDHDFHEQPGIVLLVNLLADSITNLTFPPFSMESTWAGDYDMAYESYWTNPDRRPYLIHWAGEKVDPGKDISQLFLQFLTETERDFFLRSYRRPSQSSFIPRVTQSTKAFLRALLD